MRQTFFVLDFFFYDEYFTNWKFLFRPKSAFGGERDVMVCFSFFTLFFMVYKVIDTADNEKLGLKVKFQVKIDKNNGGHLPQLFCFFFKQFHSNFTTSACFAQ